MTIVRESRTHKEINYKTTYRNGGFITYWKLYFQFIPTYHQAVKDFPFLKKTWAWFTFFLKTFWWLLIKPFGCMYSYTKTLKGDFYYFEDPHSGTKTIDEKRFRVKKYVTHKLFRIPVFKHRYIITKEDRDKLVQ